MKTMMERIVTRSRVLEMISSRHNTRDLPYNFPEEICYSKPTK